MGLCRILRNSSGVMSVVWRNPRIQDHSGFSEKLVRSGWQIVFTLRRRIREFCLWSRAAFGAKEKILWFL